MNKTILLSCLSAFLFSVLATGLVRIYSLKKQILDIPNERSSHITPTPRGGGIAIVTTFFLSILCLFFTDRIDANLFYALAGGGFAIAAIGYYDDIFSMKARWRFLIHFFAACWAAYWIEGFSINVLLTLLGIIWCINFYNFMDGIDGLAGSEGIFLSIASGIMFWLAGAMNLAFAMWLLSAAIIGFTLWNWPPAKIFLGDVGSGFLGYIFSVFGLYSINKNYASVSFWWIILSIFLCDSTFTLLYRIYQGKNWYSAHHEHAYQHLVSFGATHKLITSCILLINFFILFPLAYAVLYYPTKAFWFAVATTLFLFLIWFKIKLLPIKNS
jgi:Fuc2NAc and GlcNAc transferase